MSEQKPESKKVASLDALYSATKNMTALMDYHGGQFYAREVVDYLYRHYQLHGENPMSMSLSLMRGINNLQPQLHPMGDKAPSELVSGVTKESTDKALSDFMGLIKGLIVQEEKGFMNVVRELPIKQRETPFTNADISTITRKSKLWAKIPQILRDVAEDKYSYIKTFYWVEGEALWLNDTTISSSEGYRWRNVVQLKNSRDAKTFYLWLLNNYDWTYIDLTTTDMQHRRDVHYVIPAVRAEIVSLLAPDEKTLLKILNPDAWYNQEDNDGG